MSNPKVTTESVVKKFEEMYPDTRFTSEWNEIIDTWLEHKRGVKSSYKTDKSAAIMVKKLINMSDYEPAVAMEIVERSIMNNWSGLFPLKYWEKEQLLANKKSENDEQGVSKEDPRADYF